MILILSYSESKSFSNEHPSSLFKYVSLLHWHTHQCELRVPRNRGGRGFGTIRNGPKIPTFSTFGPTLVYIYLEKLWRCCCFPCWFKVHANTALLPSTQYILINKWKKYLNLSLLSYFRLSSGMLNHVLIWKSLLSAAS